MPLKAKKKLLVIFSAAVLSVSFFLRIYPALIDTTHFSFDQGLDIIMVKSLVIDHKINLISRYSGLQGVLMGPLWTWFLAPPFFLSGGNPSANVIYLTLFSLVTAFLGASLIAKKLGKAAGILTLLFLLFAPIFTSSAQVVLSPNPLVFLFIFFLIFSFEVFVQKNARFLWLLLFLAGLFFQLEIAFALFALLTFVVLFLVFGGWWTLKKRSFWLGAALFIIAFVPQIVFDLRHNFLTLHSLAAFFVGNSNSLYHQSSPFLIRIGERLHSFYEDATTMALFGPWYLNLPVFILAVWGWYLAFKNKNEVSLSWFKLLATTLAAFFVGFSLYPGAIWGWYRAGLPVVYVLLITLPVALLWQSVPKTRMLILTAVVLLLIWGTNPVGIAKNLTRPDPGGVPTLRNQKMAIDKVYQLAAGRPFNYYVYTPPVYNYIWQHDFWWYGQKKYGYMPKNWRTAVPLLGIGEQPSSPLPGSGLTYLIIEPDSERPGEAQSWERSFIKSGQVQKRISVAGGVVVEERII